MTEACRAALGILGGDKGLTHIGPEVVVMSRGDWDDTMELLNEYRKQLKSRRAEVKLLLAHCPARTDACPVPGYCYPRECKQLSDQVSRETMRRVQEAVDIEV